MGGDTVWVIKGSGLENTRNTPADGLELVDQMPMDVTSRSIVPLPSHAFGSSPFSSLPRKSYWTASSVIRIMTTSMPSVSSLLTPGFKWDGTTSDFAQQFYRRYLANDTAPSLQISTTPLPDVIQKRLDAVNTTFAKLPGLLQRALVWDSGFAISTHNELVRVQTLNGVSMAQIAVSKSDYENVAGCTSQNCTQPDGIVWYKSLECNGVQMNAISRCLVDDFDGGAEFHLSMWSTGGEETMIPEMRLLKHVWDDYAVSAIHTATSTNEPAYDNCGAYGSDRFSPGVGSIVIACYPPEKITVEMKAQMKPPAPGAIVTAWLQQQGKTIPADTNAAHNSGNEFNLIWLVPILVGVFLLVIGFIWWCRRRRANRDANVDPSNLLTPVTLSSKNEGSPSVASGFLTINLLSGDRSTMLSGVHPSLHSAEDYDSGASNSVMKILLGDPHLINKQLTYDQVHFDQLVSKGAYGEVWVGYCDRRVVALKRLLRNKQPSFADVEMFAHEIQLTATLKHPNIVEFLGVAWNSLENLVMIMEYLPRGDLTHVLRTNGSELTWDFHKLTMARGLVSALAYLHTQSSSIIHRDLKSKNVLLSDEFAPKLIDFGVSRRKKDRTMTAGVGTPYWTAPEVLEGTRYTEKSDIYSFGVLLTEVDTCQSPYHDVKGENGEKLQHFRILNLVMSGALRPSLTKDSPDKIRTIVIACLQHDPEKRPTALEVVRMLE